MEINIAVLISLYVLSGAYILYKIFFKKNPYQEDYERMYNEIINSDKCKVKGQYDNKE